MDQFESLWHQGSRLVTIPRPGGLLDAGLARILADSVGEGSNLGISSALFCELGWARTEADVVEGVSQSAGFAFEGLQGDGTESEALGEALAGRDQLLLVLTGFDVPSEVASSTVEAWLMASSSLRVVVTSPRPLGLEGESVLKQREEDGEHPSSSPAVDWTSLPEVQQRLLISLASFRGGCSVGAAVAVAELGGVEEARAPLESLADASLLEWVPVHNPSGVGSRAHLRADIRTFLENSSGPVALFAAAAERHRDYFLAEGRRLFLGSRESESSAAEPAVRVGDGAALAWVVAERQNLLAVQERFSTTQPEAAAEAVLFVVQGMLRRGPYLASLERLGAVLGSLPEEAPTELRARLLLARGVAGRMASGGELGVRALEEARDLATAVDLVGLACEATEQLGLNALRAGRLSEAQGFLGTAARTAEERGLAETAARVQCSLGLACEAAGDFECAEAAFLAAVAQASEGAALRELIRSRSRLGAHYYFVDRWDEATTHLLWSFEQATQRGELFLAACSAYNLGRLSLNLGDLDEADVTLHGALRDFAVVGNRKSEAYVRIELGVLHLERRELGLAREHLLAAVKQLAPLRHLLVRVYAQITLVQVELASGRIAEARSWHEKSLGAAVRLNHRPLEGLVHCVGSAIEFVAGAQGPCASARDRAKALLANMGWAEGRGLLSLAEAFAGEELDMDPVQTQARARVLLPLLGRESKYPSVPSAPWHSGPRVLPSLRTQRGQVLRLAGDWRWFEVDGQARVDLSRKRTLRPLLKALAEESRIRPGAGLSVDAVFTAVWGTEFCLPDARKNRIYVAVAALRKLGLDELILTRGDGYLLLPGLRVEVEPVL